MAETPVDGVEHKIVAPTQIGSTAPTSSDVKPNSSISSGSSVSLSSSHPPPSVPPVLFSSPSTALIRRNWYFHSLYLRGFYSECLKQIDITLKEVRGLSEYAIYIKGLIKRHMGLISESLTLFQAAAVLNPFNLGNLKQVARSLFLMGRHRQAIEVYEETIRLSQRDSASASGNSSAAEDWSIHHNLGLCYLYLKNYPKSVECFKYSNSIDRHDSTYLNLGKVLTIQEQYEAAVEVYLEALEFSPENSELLTTLGLLYLRLGQNYRAFDFLGNSLTHDPKNPKAILAAGSIIQDHNDMDVALVKYRIAAVATPNSAQLWNNIGLCLFGKFRYVAAISCLKRALYLDPFEWIIAYNLGLVHLTTGQYASAFHFLSSAINLKPDFPSSYMHLGVCLSKLGDFNNSQSSYEKSLTLENDHLFHLNFSISLINQSEFIRARVEFNNFQTIWNGLEQEIKTAEPEIFEIIKNIEKALAAAE